MELDCTNIGLKCGLEIHQQLDTKKLFCGCPGQIREELPDITIKRKIRSSAGEGGMVDIAALHEMRKDRWYIYEAYKDTTCNVEMDEEPPHHLNPEALQVALQVALLLKATIVQEIQVMRKIVIDGSNTSGFQRTALVARNGVLQTSKKKITLPTICIEEDAARIMSQDKEKVVYRLDRLGIPLLEIATGPEIETPEEAKEVAYTLGLLIRSTGKAKRGLGTIRQDINISIKDGARVEIKGCQDLHLIPTVVNYECMRQQQLIAIAGSPRKTNAHGEIKDLTALMNSSTSHVIQRCLEQHGKVVGMKLAGFAGMLGKELQPGRRLGTEFSDRAKIRAGVGGLFHSDELPKYGITQDEVNGIKKALACTDEDAFVLIADQETAAREGLKAVQERTALCNAIPEEVRKANADGTSSFLRPMPGAARMYPETDVKPIRPLLKGITLPESIEEKIVRFEKQGLGKDLAELLAKSEDVAWIESLFLKHPALKPAFIAETVLSLPKTMARREKIEVHIPEKIFAETFAAVEQGKILKESIANLLLMFVKTGKLALASFSILPDEELKHWIQKIVTQNSEKDKKQLIGIAMTQLRGKADALKIIAIVEQMKS